MQHALLSVQRTLEVLTGVAPSAGEVTCTFSSALLDSSQHALLIVHRRSQALDDSVLVFFQLGSVTGSRVLPPASVCQLGFRGSGLVLHAQRYSSASSALQSSNVCW